MFHRSTSDAPFNLWAAECATAVDTPALAWMTQGKKTLWLDCRGGASRQRGNVGSTEAETATMQVALPDNVEREPMPCNELLVTDRDGNLVYLDKFQKAMEWLAGNLLGKGYENVVTICNQAANRTPFVIVTALMMMYNTHTEEEAVFLYRSLRRLRCIFDMTTTAKHGEHTVTT